MVDQPSSPDGVKADATKVHDREVSSASSNHPLNDGTSYTDDWWLWEVTGIVGSALAIGGIVLLLALLDGKVKPKWGISIPDHKIGNKIIYGRTIEVTLNSIISILSTAAKICVLIPVTKGLGQLKWVWFSQRERVLADFEKFENATKGLTGSALLLWRLRGRQVVSEDDAR